MNIILAGYPGSQPLVPASKYLVEKYLPGFNTIFLNYTGEISGWSKFIADYLRTLDDEKIIFALDDYLMRGADLTKLSEALEMAPCVKLCECSPAEQAEYPVTTQYTVWLRKELINLLELTTTPWDFEINGSKLFMGTSQVYTCLDYDVHSALSSRWSGIHLDGIKQEDLDAIEKLL